jgi:hypothetical protein
VRRLSARCAQEVSELDPLELVGCPHCAVPAEISERFVLQSTDGPIEFARVACLARHWLTGPVGSLHRAVLRPVDVAAVR